jgi:hypothetical protein
MKTFEEDLELKQLLKNVKTESPGSDFSARVMKQIFAEQAALERVRKEPVLGKGFWVILSLFAVLIAAVALSPGAPASNITPALLSEINTDAVMTGYRSFFEKLGGLPVSIAGIFLATSLLVFLEKILGSRNQVLS